MAEYVKEKKSGGMDMPQEPPLRTLIVPANSSASAFLRIAKDNDGIILLFETEGDTLSQTLKSDYGNYSDVLRKAFHHEVLSMSRCKDREMSEVEQPRISVVLAGTPGQVNRLISNEEDGLLSRFCFYALPFKRGIRNVFATSDVAQSKNAKFKLLGSASIICIRLSCDKDHILFVCHNICRRGLYPFFVRPMKNVAMR